MKRLLLLGLIGGLVLTAWLIWQVGVPQIWGALRQAGFTTLLLISIVHFAAIILTATAWGRLQPESGRLVFFWARMLRDAGSELLPLSQLGGLALGTRALIVHGMEGTRAAALSLLDALLEFCAELIYAGFGLLFFFSVTEGVDLPLSVLIAVPLALGILVAVLALSRVRFDFLTRLPSRGPLRRLLGTAAMIHAEIGRLYARKRGLALSFFLHLAAWIVAGIEAWLALWIMGAGLSLTSVLAMESLVYATRALAFLVPNAIGIQEGAFMVIGASLGLSPDLALGLSLLKRGRDLVIGFPTLIAWQIIEGRQWRALKTRDRARDEDRS
ncbi:MAG TPA: lysylphosphatidylglycerol synthase domain-containing protein [Stellaceae bacterium]|nr:lysylphosphatidylglycerol synthase domain-containing protein [Stellaceae bacterium]